jgi:hypothetical protein
VFCSDWILGLREGWMGLGTTGGVGLGRARRRNREYALAGFNFGFPIKMTKQRETC